MVVLIWMTGIMACNRDEIPADVLKPDRMEKVITDVLMAESFAESYLLIDTSKKRDQWFTGELNKVLAINKITQDQFRRSMDYYKTRPDLFKTMVDTINARALRNRDKVYDMQSKKRFNPQ